MKVYITLLLLIIAFGNLAKGQCTFLDRSGGVRDYHIDYTPGQSMSGGYLVYNITCDASVTLAFNTIVEDHFYDSFQFLMDEMPTLLEPRLTAIVDFDAVSFENYRHRYRKQWDFPKKIYTNLTSTGDVAVIPAGEYRVSVQNYNPSYFLKSGTKPYYYPWPTMSQRLFTVGNLEQTFSVTPASGVDLCTSDSYQITTLPSSTIDFGELDKKDLQKGRSFLQPFSIDISRVPGDKCYELVYPNIEFYSETSLLGNNNTDIILDNGLLLRIKDSNGQPIVFGDKINLGKIKATDQRLQGNFKGEIRKNPERSVKTGEFNAIVRYIVHMR